MGSLRACTRRFALGAALMAGVAGCGISDSEPPDSATFRVQATHPIEVVTSTVFTVDGTSVALIEADTLMVTGLHEQTVSLPSPPRFYIRATSATEGNTVAVRVDIGEKNWYDVNQGLEPEESLQFFYGFSG